MTAAQLELRSEITCPHCGHRKVEEMPTDACQFFYECEDSRTLLRPKLGDCCVFCSAQFYLAVEPTALVCV